MVLVHDIFLQLIYNWKAFAACHEGICMMKNLHSCSTQKEVSITTLIHIKFLLKFMEVLFKAAGLDHVFAVQCVLQCLVLFNSTVFVFSDSLHKDVLWDKVTNRLCCGDKVRKLEIKAKKTFVSLGRQRRVSYFFGIVMLLNYICSSNIFQREGF